MKIKSLLALAAILASTGAVTTASAQTVLAVDFNASFDANSTTETSIAFSGFNTLTNGGSLNPSATFGAYTVQFFGATVQGRYRSSLTDSGSFTYNDMMEDLATNFNRVLNASATSATTPTANAFTISGLQANTTYQIQLWSLDRSFNNGAVQYWWNTTSGTGASATLLGSITNSTSILPTSNDSYSVVGTVTSSATGTLSFGHVTTLGNGVLNGFVLSAIPEPSAFAALAGLFTLGFAAYRRRRS